MGINTDVDFAMYLGRDDLLERQEILSDTTEADIYFKGGGEQTLKVPSPL